MYVFEENINLIRFRIRYLWFLYNESYDIVEIINFYRYCLMQREYSFMHPALLLFKMFIELIVLECD